MPTLAAPYIGIQEVLDRPQASKQDLFCTRVSYIPHHTRLLPSSGLVAIDTKVDKLIRSVSLKPPYLKTPGDDSQVDLRPEHRIIERWII